MIIGLMPSKIHGDLPTREAVNINLWEDDKQMYIDRWAAYNTPYSLNINHHGIGNEPVPYFDDLGVYEAQLRDIMLYAKPMFITCENEEQHEGDGIYHSDPMSKYNIELTSCRFNLPKNIPFTNGGFTLPLSWWYLQQTNDVEFRDVFGLNITGKEERISHVQAELDLITKFPKRFKLNFHCPISDLSQVSPYIRMINFISKYTANKHQIFRDCLSNEAAIHFKNITIEQGLLAHKQIAEATEMSHLIFYCGDGSTLAEPISVEQVKAIL